MVCSTPIVLLIFRRPNLTARVFEQIRAAKPSKLLVVADGPRNEAEQILCNQTRAVTEQVDWDCEILQDFSEENLGCRRRVASGLNWAFDQVEEAIILEDDCLPHPDFFRFCQTLLDYYRSDERVWVISGNNFQNGHQRGDGSYYFSRYNHCWGWATWKRAWEQYDGELKTWPQFRAAGLLNSVLENPKEVKFWTELFDSFHGENKIDTWDCQWTYTCWAHSGLTILPNINLVSNIGFGLDSTHTRDASSNLANIPARKMEKIKHPNFLVRDNLADAYTFNNVFCKAPYKGVKNITSKIKIHLGRAIKKLALKT